MSQYLARFWRSISRQIQSRLVGRDLEGNNFYESKIPGDDRRTRRTVEYNRHGDMWDSASGISNLPAQWTSWLSHTRHNPPTLDELQKDKARQQQLALNVARLEAQEQEEVRRRNEGIANSRLKSIPVESTSTPFAAPESKPIGPTPEPQSWAPQLTRRG